MTKRICPNCGRPWYSLDTTNIWTCQECEPAITPDAEVPLMEKEDYLKGGIGHGRQYDE